jgi:hypothetical protein
MDSTAILPGAQTGSEFLPNRNASSGGYRRLTRQADPFRATMTSDSRMISARHARVTDGDRGAGIDEHLRKRLADTAPAADDDGMFALERRNGLRQNDGPRGGRCDKFLIRCALNERAEIRRGQPVNIFTCRDEIHQSRFVNLRLRGHDQNHAMNVGSLAERRDTILDRSERSRQMRGRSRVRRADDSSKPRENSVYLPCLERLD